MRLSASLPGELAGTGTAGSDHGAEPGAGGGVEQASGDSRAAGLLDATSGSRFGAMIAAGRARAGEFTWERCAEAHARVWASVA